MANHAAAVCAALLDCSGVQRVSLDQDSNGFLILTVTLQEPSRDRELVDKLLQEFGGKRI